MRFVDLLERGGPLYGLGAGCDEWRAAPGEYELDLTHADEEDEGVDADEKEGDSAADEVDIDGDENEGVDENASAVAGDDVGHKRAGVPGRLTARAPDAEGRVYSFSYDVIRAPAPVRMRIVGRGGWSPAPGVTIRDPENENLAVIGTASYCITEVDVRANPRDDGAILVGEETWFLTRDACQRSRSVSFGAPRRCSDLKKRAPVAPGRAPRG